MTSKRLSDFRITVLAGVAAGVVATAAEILLWWVNSVPVEETLVRDARLAAAIFMGPRALSSPGAPPWLVMIVATVVHFGLSIAYACALAVAIRRLPPWTATATGAVFGLLLYIVNMYGFTLLFPWFAAARDSITATAHIVFGAAAAAVYALVRGRFRNG